MKLGIGYEYIQYFLPNKRCKKERRMTRKSTITVDIREVTEMDFPLAIKVKDKEVFQDLRRMSNYLVGDSAEKHFGEIRGFAGKLWSMAYDHSYRKDKDGNSAKPVLEALEPGSEEFNRKLANPRYFPVLNDSEYIKGISILLDTPEADDSKETVEGEIRERAERYILFDNILWYIQQEPYVQVTYDTWEKYTWVHLEESYTDTIPAENHYLLTELDYLYKQYPKADCDEVKALELYPGYEKYLSLRHDNNYCDDSRYQYNLRNETYEYTIEDIKPEKTFQVVKKNPYERANVVCTVKAKDKNAAFVAFFVNHPSICYANIEKIEEKVKS